MLTPALKLKLSAALFTGLWGLFALPSQASAFCGFYVSSTDAPLYNSATQVVLMREGTRTSLSMRNTYRGPAEDFAMVVPVPVVLQESDVKTLDDAIFTRLNTFTAPRLVEYFEKNPCDNSRTKKMRTVEMSASPQTPEGASDKEPLVMVEAQFEVGEYEIVILSAKESTALETWLKANKYTIPQGASDVLQSYITQGQYFFVARVNADKVTFNAEGDAVLSPLRFSYDSEDFALPVRLGLLNAIGEQDLLVHILSREGRYRVANAENVTIPTNLIVDEQVKGKFTDFYEALFARVHKEDPTAIVTEYAWGGPGVADQNWTSPAKCDPCAEPISMSWTRELMSLGADQLDAPRSTHTTGAMVASASAMAIDAEVTPMPQPPPVQTFDDMGMPMPSDAPEPEPEATLYELTGVQSVFTEQTAKLGKCYETMGRTSGSLPKVMDVRVEIAPDGSVSSITSVEPAAQQSVDALSSCAGLESLVFAVPEAGATVKSTVRLQFDVSYVDTSWLELNAWTVTRLHARYTAEQLQNDLFFVAAPPIEGGRGTPRGQDPKMRTTAAASTVNNFQARYMILHPYTAWHMCTNPDTGNWTGSGMQPAPANMDAPTASLSEEDPLNLMQVVRTKRGWLKTSRK